MLSSRALFPLIINRGKQDRKFYPDGNPDVAFNRRPKKKAWVLLEKDSGFFC